MNEREIHSKILKYFKIEELVGPRTTQRYGDRALRFFDLRLLETIITARELLKKPITVNNWHNGGQFSQRGLRTNIQQIVKDKSDGNKLYISAHILGKALDFDVQGMTAGQVREWFVANSHLMPYKIRLEDGVTWVHLDVTWEDKNPPVYLFNP